MTRRRPRDHSAPWHLHHVPLLFKRGRPHAIRKSLPCHAIGYKPQPHAHNSMTSPCSTRLWRAKHWPAFHIYSIILGGNGFIKEELEKGRMLWKGKKVCKRRDERHKSRKFEREMKRDDALSACEVASVHKSQSTSWTTKLQHQSATPTSPLWQRHCSLNSGQSTERPQFTSSRKALPPLFPPSSNSTTLFISLFRRSQLCSFSNISVISFKIFKADSK